MTSAELIAAGHAMFGERWLRPLARTIGWSHGSLRIWRKGQRAIPESAAEKIRMLERVGPVGVLVRQAVRELIPEAGAWAAHRVAQRTVEHLIKAGLLDLDC